MVSFVLKYHAKLSRSVALWQKIISLLNYSSTRYAVIVLCVTVLEIAFTLGGFFAVKGVVNIIARSEDISAHASSLFSLVALVLGLFLIGRIMQSVANYYRAAQGYIVSDYVSQAIQKRAIEADLSFYDSSLYYDSLERARQAGAQRPAVVIANALNVVRSALLLIGIIIVFGSVEWRLLPVILIAAVLILLVQIRFTRERFEHQRQLVQKERHASYADWIMSAQEFAKEIRLWNLGAHLRKTYMDIRVAVRADYLAIERRKSISEIIVSAVGTLLFIGSGGFLLYQVSLGQSTISDLVLVILLLQRAEAGGRDLVMNLSRLYDDQLFLTQLFLFLDMEPDIEKGGLKHPMPEAGAAGVRLENVSFSYPKSDTPALSNVSLQIKPGQFTALVGGNGSGKTTLIKLLCRLYDPQEGRVTLNGRDVRDLDIVAYRRQFSVIFQDFVRFAYTGRANIQLADMAGPQDQERLLQTAKLTGADDVLRTLPKGYETVLSRMFDDGVELSGGQWQKVALARAVFPASSFIILDEPTSAIDPNAEAELFDGFREKMEGRGALVISHRLSTIRKADYTYVLDQGRVVEEGTHDDLIALDGTYAQMFLRQGRGYRD